MKHTVRDFELLDARISTFNYRNIRHVDWALAGLTFILALIGFAVLFSASKGASLAVPYYIKQMVYFAAGTLLALFVLCIDSRFLVSIAPFLYVVFVGLLLAVILFGVSAKGGQRWLPLGVIRLQPSEQTKVVLVYALAWYLTTVGERIRKFHYLLIALAIVAIPAALILKQPNLGTAVVLIPTGVVMVYVAGCKWWHLLLLFGAAVSVVPFAYPFLKDHQKARIEAFVNPEADPKGTGWQTRQSKITVGSGGLAGKGFLNGTQTMLNYLPEHHTDFIFSLLAEEKGFMGALAVIALFTAFLLRGLQLALRSPDVMGTLLAAGCVTILAFHTFVNIAITVGLMPVTGIPLPFLSFGGNFYLTTMMCVGVLMNVPVRKQLFD